MPWRLRREIMLLLFGVACMAVSIVVFVLNQNVSSDLLAAIGFIGGCAIIVNQLPSNGKNGHE